MTLGLTMSPRQTQTLSLTLAQQHLIVQTHLLTQRLSLLQALRWETYTPTGNCPRCNRKLTPLEILGGFNNDPTDYTTRCSGCGHRFEPKLICFGNESRIELQFFCSLQTLERLRGKETLSPTELMQGENASVYRSAIVHHGSLKTAFREIGIAYAFEENLDWKNKVQPFLGRLPDAVIADCVDVHVSAIGSLRKKLKIKSFNSSKRELVEEYE